MLSTPFFEDAFFFSLYNFSLFVGHQVLIGVWINIWVFGSIPLIHLSVFVPIQCSFHYYSSMIELEVRDGDASRSTFLVQDCFGYPGLFVFPYEVEYCSFEVHEELGWDFDEDCVVLNL